MHGSSKASYTFSKMSLNVHFCPPFHSSTPSPVQFKVFPPYFFPSNQIVTYLGCSPAQSAHDRQTQHHSELP